MGFLYSLVRPNQSYPEIHIDTFSRVGAALLGALFIGFFSGFALLVIAPCSWFGSSFEGACGYGAVFSAVLLGLTVATISFAVLLWFALRSKLKTTSIRTAEPSSKLYRTWLALLVLQYVGPLLLVFILNVGVLPMAVSLLLQAGFIAASAVLAPYRARHPATCFLALVPFVGPLIVGALLFKQRAVEPIDGV